MIRSIRATFATLVLSAVFLGCPGDSDSAPTGQQTEMQEVAIINTMHGEIVVRFFPDLAPQHVESFKKLTRDNFYDGTLFHRVIPGFMIQGGDPLTKDPANRPRFGTGGPGYNIPAEFSERSHKRGILSAARSADPNSAGSQFFIVVSDAPHLDRQYTVFGEVVEGMDVVDKIVTEPRDGNDLPQRRIEMTVRLEEREVPAN